MRYLIIILLTSVNTKMFGQTKIEFPELFDGKAIIFNNNPKISFDLPDMYTSAYVEKSDIYNVESLLSDYLSSTKNKKLKYFNRNFNRQYTAYYNEKNEKIIIVSLLNFKKKKLVKVYFPDFEFNLIYGSGQFYEENVFIFKVNTVNKNVQPI